MSFHTCLPSPDRTLIGWEDVGTPFRPGPYTCWDGTVLLQHEHISALVEEPRGVWEATREASRAGTVRYTLTHSHPHGLELPSGPPAETSRRCARAPSAGLVGYFAGLAALAAAVLLVGACELGYCLHAHGWVVHIRS